MSNPIRKWHRVCVLAAAAALIAATMLAGAKPSAATNYGQDSLAPVTLGIALSGRVVSPDGKPLGRVAVHITVKSEYSYTDPTDSSVHKAWRVTARDLVTDTDGRFATTGIIPKDVIVIFVNEPGYRYMSGGSLSSVNGAYVASDLVTAPPTAALDGTVQDASGAPVSGAVIVAPSDNPQSVAVTDTSGHFTLGALPAGQIDVIAAGAPGVTIGSYRTGASAALVLKSVPQHDAPDVSDATSILTGDYKAASAASYPGTERMVLDLAGVDPAGAVALASLNGATPADTTLYGIALAAARANPANAVIVAPNIVSQIGDPAARAIAASYVGLYLVGTDKDTARKLLDIGRTAAAHSPFEKYGGADKVAVAALACRLGDKDGPRILDDTIKDLHSIVDRLSKDPANKIDPDIINTTLAVYAETIAPAGSALIERCLAQIVVPPAAAGIDPRLMARTKAIETLAEFDPADALSMLQKYDAQDVGAPLFGEATVAVLEQLGKPDAAGAMAAAQQVADQQHRPIALALAARLQTPDAGAPVFRDALAAALASQQRSALGGWVASLAYELDPALGKELFKSAFTQLSSMSTVNGGLSPFYFYYQEADPVQSRIGVEREYATASHAQAITGEGDAMMIPVLAMSSMDPDRAAALANTIPGTPRFEALRKVAQYMLAAPMVKRTMRFDRWTEGDGWIPGRPTGT